MDVFPNAVNVIVIVEDQTSKKQEIEEEIIAKMKEAKKLAHREYAREYYQKNYAKNKEPISYTKEFKQAYHRQYYKKNRDKIIERASEWNKAHNSLINN